MDSIKNLAHKAKDKLTPGSHNKDDEQTGYDRQQDTVSSSFELVFNSHSFFFYNFRLCAQKDLATH
jgi:hypothetical protein